ncbi:hypothetical protein E0485_21050 [Paenibacillus albiflavus]|uniref:YgxA-like substrate binding domain-containing protein n=1 Tax=Paenibacillus albiflavus TaxID=2545760 RepID=A0A4R4E397_9BACL|nr:hypothetical protein [Paenibacillus albiflavus]TCZ73397.1 hypothetical protein E0485_21050 [Paenibacillus albiflavus]
MERDVFSAGLQCDSLELSQDIQNQKLFVEYTKLLYKCAQSKQLLEVENDMDAYRYALDALSHWARICVLEQGHYPEVSIMMQIKSINYGIYKLYEELTTSSESIKQRVELVLLACEFGMGGILEKCSIPLMDTLRSRSDCWSIEELREIAGLQEVGDDIRLVLDKLTKKSFVKAVFVTSDPELNDLTMTYMV